MKRIILAVLVLSMTASFSIAANFYWKSTFAGLDAIADVDGDRGIVIDSSGLTTFYMNNGAGWVVGSVLGKVQILDNVTSPTVAQCYGSLNIMTGSGTVLLPTAVTGLSICIQDSGVAHDIIVDVDGSDTMTLDGTTQAAGVGITNASGTSTGDMICVAGTGAGTWSTVGYQGSWVSQ